MNRFPEPKKIGCIILAAGMSVRFGGLKQLVEIKGKSLLQHAVDVANDSKADYVILVVGAHSSEILGKIQTGRAQIVLNKDYARGQSTSLRCGITNLPNDCGGAIIMVADQPFLRSEYLNQMISDFKKKRKVKAVIALSHKGETRNPVLIPKELFPKILKLEGDAGARAIIQNYDNLRLVEIRDKRAFFDIDTKYAVSELNKIRKSSK